MFYFIVEKEDILPTIKQELSNRVDSNLQIREYLAII